MELSGCNCKMGLKLEQKKVCNEISESNREIPLRVDSEFQPRPINVIPVPFRVLEGNACNVEWGNTASN